MKVIVYDDFSKNTKQVYQEVLQFVQVPDNGRSEFPKMNAGRKIHNRFLVGFLRSRIVFNSVIAFKKSLNLKTLGFGRPDLPMPAPVRSRLVREFSDEISLLEEILGRDLAIWRQA